MGARRKGQTKWIKMVSDTFPALNHTDPYGKYEAEHFGGGRIGCIHI